MGDAGSAFLGAFYGMQSVVAALSTPVPFLVLVLPFANFILDTTFTLFRRVLGGEKWHQAHRSHVYQRLTDSGWSHRNVSILELFVSIISCAAAAACIPSNSVVRLAVSMTLFAVVACVGFWIIRRENDLKMKMG
jgi:Fuc2NAc and GlcNAc transferase